MILFIHISEDVICVNRDDQSNIGDENMALAEIKKSIQSKSHIKSVPHLNSVNGKVKIDENDLKQVKWFEQFKE